MTQPYTSFVYVPPPRTEVRLDSRALPQYERREWWAQIKRNGTNSVVFVPPDRKVFGYNRHGEAHRAWRFTPETARIFEEIPGQEWWVFNGELLHNKTKKIKHTHYLFDLLVADGVHLSGTKYRYRYERLREVFPTDDAHFGHYRADPYTCIARNYTKGFGGLFKSLDAIEDEGVVVKDPEGIWRSQNSSAWVAKFTR